MPYGNNKDEEQPAHPHSLTSAFVICCLDYKRHIVVTFKIPSLASSAAEQSGLSYLVAQHLRQAGL